MKARQKADTHFEIIGMMSGTSLDGLDLAYCIFDLESGKWKHHIPRAKTYPYPDEWQALLSGLYSADADTLARLHTRYAEFCAEMTGNFINETGLRPDYLAFHGHTIFHRPDAGWTFQLGNGATLSARTGITVISDFRTADLALGGQGAPLVPAGDRMLFGEYDICLNIGGFANISFEEDGLRKAHDVCPANILLNLLAKKAGAAFDKDGNMASRGRIITPLFDALEQLSYYTLPPPKSLGREWLDENCIPLIHEFSDTAVNDLLATCTRHVASRIAAALSHRSGARVLVTGGGACNKQLIAEIGALCDAQLIIPDDQTIQFKEALIFAFLAVLRLRGENNCLSSVTGACRDHSSGSVHRA